MLALAVLATIFWALNSTLVAPFSRQMSPTKVNAYRGVSLGILMLLPVLLMVPADGWKPMTTRASVLMTLTCIASMCGNVCMSYCQRYLPVGIALAVCLALSTIVSTIFGSIALQDQLTDLQIGIMICLIVQGLILGAVSGGSEFKTLNVPRGLAFAVGFGIFLGLGYGMVGLLSREYHPLLIGYCWEFGTGLVSCVLLLLFASMREKTEFERKSKYPVFLGIMAAASPTVIGTSCYAMATSQGAIGLVSAIVSTMGAFGALFGYFILKEKLKYSQMMMIGVMVATLVTLKLLS